MNGRLALWPAIDVCAGRVVRLLRGEREQATFFEGRPADIAARFEGEGADGLHVVDLDAAFGQGDNRDALRAILAKARVPVQVGGGIRSREEADRLFSAGAARLVLGSLLFTDPAAAEELAAAFPARLVGALDCKAARPTVRGWTRDAEAGEAPEAARAVAKLGISALLVTDVARDGAMEGPNLELLAAVRSVFPGEILASGGIRGPEDLGPVGRALEGGAAGVVVGRALHAGHTSVSALAAARRAEEGT